jgi:RimJ/RimL family protein N-acetyltransferase
MIRTARLLLRPFREDDLETFTAVLQDPGAMIAWGGPYSGERAREELQHYLDHYQRHGFAPFAVVRDDLLIGDIGLQRLEDGPHVELLYRLTSTVWRHGLATEACDASLQYGFDALKLPEIVAVIGDTNLPSQRLAAKLGFVPGDLGTYWGQQLVLHRVTPDLHARSLQRRTHVDSAD